MIEEGELLFTPSSEAIAKTNLTRYLAWLREQTGHEFTDYHALWRWSVASPEAFWGSIWRFFAVDFDGRAEPAFEPSADGSMRGVHWFPHARVNYAEHLLRHERDAPERVAIYHRTEARALGTITIAQLAGRVRKVAMGLRALGVRPGDRVVSFMPNVPETAIAMMATAAIGAVWASAAIEFGAETVIDRFAQIEPTVLLAAEGYRFGGKLFDRRAQIEAIAAALPTLRHIVWAPQLDDTAPAPAFPSVVRWSTLLEVPDISRTDFLYERVSWDHPLWIVFSSGTTGLPKAIVHGHTGTLVEHLKLTSLHLDLSPDSVMFFYSTTGWMMWNLLLSALLVGSAVVLYDGSPTSPDPSLLWRLAEETRATCFGASPTYVQLIEKAGVVPAERFDVSTIESVILSGAPSTPESFEWFYRHVKPELRVTSQSGGTELCSGLVGAVPTLPIYAGEIQARMLGMNVHVWDDDGRELDLADALGELVVTSPFPSMPLRFWNDPNDVRYREAYFDYFPNVWRHGDFIRINARGGCYISGRSDATLNRFGVRIGSAEIYRVVEALPEVADSLVVCCEQPGGRFFMPLFVRLVPGLQLDAALEERIAVSLRQQCSPRHVPERIIQVDAIPYTLTGKKMEVPVRKILMGHPAESVAKRDAMADPAALDWFVSFVRNAAAS